MMLSSEMYRFFTNKLMKAASDLCHGKILFTHEGGYSKDYVPFCGLAVISELCGVNCSHVQDPYANEVKNWGYHELQTHQKAVIDEVASLAKLNTNYDSAETIKQSIKALLKNNDKSIEILQEIMCEYDNSSDKKRKV